MIDDAAAAQARELLRELHAQVAIIAHKLDTVQGRRLRTSARGAIMQHRQVSSLRQELHEAHRLIDGLHRRFPDAREVERAIG